MSPVCFKPRRDTVQCLLDDDVNSRDAVVAVFAVDAVVDADRSFLPFWSSSMSSVFKGLDFCGGVGQDLGLDEGWRLEC